MCLRQRNKRFDKGNKKNKIHKIFHKIVYEIYFDREMLEEFYPKSHSNKLPNE